MAPRRTTSFQNNDSVPMTSQRFRAFYKDLAIIVLNTLLLVLLLNILLFGYFSIKDRSKALSISDAQWTHLQKVYGDLNRDEVLRLQTEMSARTFMYDPYTEFKERPFAGKYLTVDPNGFRPVKNQGPWPLNKEKYLTVFLFGGSTTFGYGVPDDQTIATYLQEYLSQASLGKEVRVYNFGCESYYSTQERILFEQLIKAGSIPDVAIFIDGVNDFWFYTDRPLFDENFKQMFDGQSGRQSLSQVVQKIPMVRAARSIKAIVARALKPKPEQPSVDYKLLYQNENTFLNVIDHYVKNKEMIEAVASTHGIKTLFVWQPISTYKFDPDYNLFGKDAGSERDYGNGYPVMARFSKEHPLGENFLWAADMQEGVTEPLYVDTMHYSGRMSKMIAKFLYDALMQRKFFELKISSASTDSKNKLRTSSTKRSSQWPQLSGIFNQTDRSQLIK